MFVYADYAATAPLHPAAREAVTEWLNEYGNPSSFYAIARKSKRALEEARLSVAESLGVPKGRHNRIFFTGGGTESDNWALKGAFESRKNKGRHIISSALEHHAILHVLEYLQKERGAEVTYLEADGEGHLSLEQLRGAIRDDTTLITVMTANNEIGTINPIKKIVEIAHERGVWVHTDAVQAVGHIPLSVAETDVDMLSLSGHKFGAPKGVGALYLKNGINIPPLIHGGGHESGRRSGTENVAGIVAMARALAASVGELETETQRLTALRTRLTEGLSRIPYSHLTGSCAERLPGHVSFIFEAVEGESLVLSLDMCGVCVSSGSACSSGSLDPSHVLLGTGWPHELAHGSLRLTLGRDTTESEVEYIIEKVAETVEKRRGMSPLWSGGKPTASFAKSK